MPGWAAMRCWVGVVGLAALASPALADNPNPSFYLVNRSDLAINEVYVSPANTRTWGRDRLGDDTIDAGANAPIRLLADGTCQFDLRVVYEDGRSEERRGVNTCRLDNISFSTPSGRASSQDGQGDDDPSFRLVNRGPAEIDEVYLRLAGSQAWGEDRLADDTLSANDDTVIRLPKGQCLWDIRVVYQDRKAQERRRVNLCDIQDLTFP